MFAPRDMPSKPCPSPPDAAQLHDAALAYLARYASTEAGLRRVLHRKVDRWAQSQAQDSADAARVSREAIDDVVQRLLKTGLLNDAGFAEIRAKSLARGGHSKRAIQAQLVAKGIAPAIARAFLPLGTQAELAAALVMTRRRRMGAYRSANIIDGSSHLKELGRLARAGFSRDVAERALDMTREEADSRIKDLRD